MSKKNPPQKKRHTKPCRYFQINRCPHPPDVCDFAHVLVAPPLPSPVIATSPAHPFFPPHYYSIPPPPGDAPAFVPKPDSRPNSRPASFDGAAYPTYWAFPPYSPSIAQVVESSIITSPPRSRNSFSTNSTTSTSTEPDDAIPLTEDPRYPEHSHLYQSQIRVVDDASLVHVSPYYHNLPVYSPGGRQTVAPGIPFDHHYATVAVPPAVPLIKAPVPKNQCKSSKRKSLKYKTKPCKFFTVEKGCPNGDACTFIHDEADRLEALALLSIASDDKAESQDDHDECDSASTALGTITVTTKKNFFPIPWRVIGGGVLVGVKKPDPEDMPSEKNIISPPRMLTRKRSNSIPSTPSPPSVKIDQQRLFSAESPGVL